MAEGDTIECGATARDDLMGGRDMEQLRAFQRALVPTTCVGSSFIGVRAAFRPAGSPVGGDFHDAFPLDGGDQACLIGDVTGHGLPSALVMAVLFGAVREAFRWSRTPCAVMNDLHLLLDELGRRSGGPRLFSASLFLGVVSPDGSLLSVNAGHPPPLLLRADGRWETLPAAVAPLGLLPPERCSSECRALEPGDRLLLYTDGLFAAEPSPEEVRERWGSLGDDAALEALLTVGSDDDRTAMVVSYLGAPEARATCPPT